MKEAFASLKVNNDFNKIPVRNELVHKLCCKL